MQRYGKFGVTEKFNPSSKKKFIGIMEEREGYNAVMKFSTWPETTLQYGHRKNSTSRLGNIRGHTKPKANATNRPFNQINGPKQGTPFWDTFFLNYILKLYGGRKSYDNISQPSPLMLRLRYPYDTDLLLSTCTVVPMFYDCGKLRGKSYRLKELKTYRQIRKKELNY